jgi:hypothetical protein
MTKFSHPRSRTSDEKALLDFLLSSDFPGCQELKAQADSVQAVGACDCGCGTIDLAANDPAARATCREPIPVEAYGAGVDVLLFVQDGLLSCLEIVDHGDNRPLPFPRPARLTVWIRPSLKPGTS